MYRIEISTTDYQFSHGKEPRGTGQWAFIFDGNYDEPYWAYGSYTQASNDARKLAVAKGFTKIAVGS